MADEIKALNMNGVMQKLGLSSRASKSSNSGASGQESGGQPDGTESTATPSPRGFGSWIREIVIIVVVALVLSVLIKTFLFRAFFVPSGSMEDTLEVGDRIFVNELVPSPVHLKRGDIVVFKDTQGWLPPLAPAQPGVSHVLKEGAIFLGLAPDDSAQYLVKRVIGLPGDEVRCCSADGKLSVNGTSIDEPYLKPGVEPSQLPFDVKVPAGQIWVMGDNRSGSADSRAHMDTPGKGFVPVDDVVGSVALIAFPFDRFKFISNPEKVFADVPAPSGK